MKKIIKITSFIFFFHLACFPKETAKNKAIIEKIEESVYTLKYSQDLLKKKNAVNFIFDNIEKAMPIIEKVVGEEDQDLTLANLIQIVDVANKNFSNHTIEKLIEKDYSKPLFVSTMLSYLKHRKQKKIINKLFYKVFKSKNNLEAKNQVLKFLRKNNNIDSFKNFLINYLLTTNSFFLSQEIIKTLSCFKIEKEHARNIFRFLGSIDEGVREATILFFSKYPEYTEYFIKKFYKCNDFFLKDSIIQILSYYNNTEVLNFFLNNINDKLYQKSIVKGLINLKIEAINTLKRLIDFYKSSDITVKSIIVNVISFKFKDMNSKLKRIIVNFVREELKKAYIKKDKDKLYFLLKSLYNIDCDDKEIKKLLISIKNQNLNWVINKTILQILDLNQ